ncbi:hypothetical protein F5887DRAFT_882602 [Amanita rubescens]|nr:hypothetical protein F5887DRAFT_882602 [Amanita rubescens]
MSTLLLAVSSVHDKRRSRRRRSLKLTRVSVHHPSLHPVVSLALQTPTRPTRHLQIRHRTSQRSHHLQISIIRPSRRPARLVETGAKKLTLLYTKLVAEGSSGSPPGGTSIEFTILPFPADLLASLRPLVSFLRTLPLPATHPTHPAAQGICSILVDAQKGYADMRGAWSKKCLSPCQKRRRRGPSYNEGGGSYEIGSSTTKARRDGVKAGKSFGKWVKLVLTVAKDEYNLLCDLAPLTSGQLVAQAYGALLLHKHTFLALSTYESNLCVFLFFFSLRWAD